MWDDFEGRRTGLREGLRGEGAWVCRRSGAAPVAWGILGRKATAVFRQNRALVPSLRSLLHISHKI